MLRRALTTRIQFCPVQTIVYTTIIVILQDSAPLLVVGASFTVQAFSL